MAAKGKFGDIKEDTPIYAVFFSGLMKVRCLHTVSAPKSVLTFLCLQLPVPVRITAGNKDYKIDMIPEAAMGQVYVVLSKSCTDFSDEQLIAGPAILEVYPKGKTPPTPHPKCH